MNKTIYKVALLSHRKGNIGHDFMAIGVEEILKKLLNDRLEVCHFEQHEHFQIYKHSRLLRFIDKINHGQFKFIRRFFSLGFVKKALWKKASWLKQFNVALLCGGPNICKNVGSSVEMMLMLDHVPGAFRSNGVPVIDIGAGSAFPLKAIPKKIVDGVDIQLLKALFSHTSYSTVRDQLAFDLCKNLGKTKLKKIICPAIASGYFFEKFKESSSYILINYQYKGANDDWGQKVDADLWKNKLISIIDLLIKKNHSVKFLCHSDWEYQLADSLCKKMRINLQIFNPKSIYDYTNVVSGAKAGIVSRIHAAVPLAGVGIPSVVVGTDTRTYTVKEIGLITYFVEEANPSVIVKDIENYLASSKEVKARLINVREQTCNEYHKILREYFT